MAQYQTGKVNVIHGSPTVTGIGTTWVTDGISSGWIFMIKSETNIYWIDSVDTENTITLSQNYYNLNGENLYHTNYAIVQDYTTNYEWPKIANADYNWVNVLRQAILNIELDMAAGERSTITFSSPTQGRSGSYYKYTGTPPSGAYIDTYYLPDSSILAEEGVLYYDSYRQEMIYLSNGMVSGGTTSGSDYTPVTFKQWKKFTTYT